MKSWLISVVLLIGPLLRSVAAEPKAPHWAFQAVRDPALPKVADAAWCRTTLDRFILERLEADGLRPAPAADKRTLIRRATFDLTGLPPSADEIDAFVADSSPEAFAKLVDRLLDSPRYGEHWGRHWLDVVRYADTAGETADYPVPVAWRYRNYVIDAFNADKPYDEFLREQIAGDILAKSGPRERYAERVTATGFLAISRRFGFDSENYHHLTIQDTIDTLGQSVLGLTLGCARCHAHKFDPVSMPDYYALYGIFASTRYAFPGSEQKQRSRDLVPLVPPAESRPKWREFENRIAALTRKIERAKQSAPTAVLRSLDEMDGDFEMQAPAAGGSKGVLVPPWVYDGPIAVTTDAQSPFKNLYPLGRVGASVAAGTNGYSIIQALPARAPSTAGDRLYVNVDFRVGPAGGRADRPHRFWLGSQAGANSVRLRAVEVQFYSDRAMLRIGDGPEMLRSLKPNDWHNLQLTLDLKTGTVSGRIGRPGDVTDFSERPLAAGWDRVLDCVGLESSKLEAAAQADLAWDNLGVQDSPIQEVSASLPLSAGAEAPGTTDISERLQRLVGLDGDFELQTDGAPPTAPWNPGPASAVKILAASQSPFRNVFAEGRLGIHLPNSGAYNGFGLVLTNRWQADKTPRLFVSFDFRCADVAAGGDGSWRFYLGHGPGNSAAVELFFNGTGFFRRSGDARDLVSPVRAGEWCQVRLELDLKARSYSGSINSESGTREFAGRFASGWDGSIDHTFIDSYGHLGGVKPALDADNFAIGETPLPVFAASAVPVAIADLATRRAQATELRRQLTDLKTEADQARKELEALLADGPVELAYAVTEGTPQDAHLQLRGDPEKPSDQIRRGLLPVLGGGPLKADVQGSGRLELAEWLTNPTNPLTARVMVNRIWEYHFGQGLVKTPNDFGTRGQPPTHPALLDHLAKEFIWSGWSVKAMHRLIMASAVYQQQSRWSVASEPVVSGRSSANSAAEDCPVIPGTRRVGRLIADSLNTDHFSPFPRRRLGAEETRDAILAVSGALDPTPGQGHPFSAPIGWGYTQHGPFNAVYDHDRRSVYLMTQRIRRHPFLALFDGADPNASTAERRTTTVPTQALFFLNDPFVHANSDRFAFRVLTAGTDDRQRIRAAYRFALGREPLPAELAEGADFLAAYRAELAADKTADAEVAAWSAFARVLIGSNEFLTID